MLLQLQQLLFAGEAVGVACEAAVGAGYAVAGYYQGYGVAAHGTAYGLCGTTAYAARYLAVGCCVSVGYGENLAPDPVLERGAARCQRRREAGALAAEVDVEPP